MKMNFQEATSQWPHFQLPPDPRESLVDSLTKYQPHNSLQSSLHTDYIAWFCNLRYVFVGFMILLGIISHFFSNVMLQLGLIPQLQWPFVTAAFLFFANQFYRRFLSRSTSFAKRNLLIQMIVDLLVLTFVTHFIGSMDTYISFTYLFHILLACLFFSAFNALLILLFSFSIYSLCIALEMLQIITSSSLLASQHFGQIAPTNRSHLINTASVLIIWLAIWYLATRITNSIRERDRTLNKTNEILIEIQKERTQHMLQTTHELKAPFAAIEANAQLLAKGYLGPLSAEAKDIVDRIVMRCKRLTRTIVEMLQLANLQSITMTSQHFQPYELTPLLEYAIALVKPVADQRNITLHTQLVSVSVFGIKDHLKMLLANLISNAVNYSRDNSEITISATHLAQDHLIEIHVQDQGIGIEADKLEQIFEEHFRTEKGQAHNSESSGLGLSIVKHIANTHQVKLWIYSQVNQGTLVRLQFAEA